MMLYQPFQHHVFGQQWYKNESIVPFCYSNVIDLTISDVLLTKCSGKSDNVT